MANTRRGTSSSERARVLKCLDKRQQTIFDRFNSEQKAIFLSYSPFYRLNKDSVKSEFQELKEITQDIYWLTKTTPSFNHSKKSFNPIAQSISSTLVKREKSLASPQEVHFVNHINLLLDGFAPKIIRTGPFDSFFNPNLDNQVTFLLDAIDHHDMRKKDMQKIAEELSLKPSDLEKKTSPREKQQQEELLKHALEKKFPKFQGDRVEHLLNNVFESNKRASEKKTPLDMYKKRQCQEALLRVNYLLDSYRNNERALSISASKTVEAQQKQQTSNLTNKEEITSHIRKILEETNDNKRIADHLNRYVGKLFYIGEICDVFSEKDISSHNPHELTEIFIEKAQAFLSEKIIPNNTHNNEKNEAKYKLTDTIAQTKKEEIWYNFNKNTDAFILSSSNRKEHHHIKQQQQHEVIHAKRAASFHSLSSQLADKYLRLSQGRYDSDKATRMERLCGKIESFVYMHASPKEAEPFYLMKHGHKESFILANQVIDHISARYPQYGPKGPNHTKNVLLLTMLFDNIIDLERNKGFSVHLLKESPSQQWYADLSPKAAELNGIYTLAQALGEKEHATLLTKRLSQKLLSHIMKYHTKERAHDRGDIPDDIVANQMLAVDIITDLGLIWMDRFVKPNDVVRTTSTAAPPEEKKNWTTGLKKNALPKREEGSFYNQYRTKPPSSHEKS